MRQESAQTVALQALSYLAGQDQAFGAFLAASGASAADVRAQASDPGFLGAVLDFVLADEALLVAFCTDAGLAFDLPLRARAALPGGDVPHWT